MDVALHRGHDNGAVAFGGDVRVAFRRGGACAALARGDCTRARGATKVAPYGGGFSGTCADCPSAVANEIEAGFHGFGGGHELGQEERALVVFLADHVEDGNEDIVDDGQAVVGLQQPLRGRCHRCLASFQHAFGQMGDGVRRIGEGFRYRNGTALWNRGATEVAPYGGGAGGCDAVAHPYGGGSGGNFVRVARVRVGFQKCPAARILAVQDAERRHGVAVADVQGVQNGHVEAGPEGGSEERAVHERPRWQTEADIRHAEHRAHAETFLHQGHCTQNLTHLILVGGGGHDEAVDGHVLARDAVSLGGSHNALGDGQALFGRGRDTVFVQSEADHRATVARHHGQHGGEVVGLAVHGVHHGAARIGASRGFDGGRIR